MVNEEEKNLMRGRVFYISSDVLMKVLEFAKG